jgi:hypothetical protein
VLRSLHTTSDTSFDPAYIAASWVPILGRRYSFHTAISLTIMPYLAHVANCSAALRWHTLQVPRPSAHTNLLPRFAGALWSKAGKFKLAKLT